MAGCTIPRGILPCLLLALLLACSAGVPLATGDLYFPATVDVAPGTQVSGDVGDLSNNDNVYLRVDEEDVGTTVTTSTPTEQWIVTGTMDAGAFPSCVATNDEVVCQYREADDDAGALTGDNTLLTPTGAGTYTNWNPTPAVANWQNVDDDPPHDVNATYVSQSISAGRTETYAMEDISVWRVGEKESGTVIAFAWGLSNPAAAEVMNNTVVTYSTLYDEGSLHTLGPGYENDTWVMAANPNTGNQWTSAEINAMEVGMWANALIETRVTSVGAVIPIQEINLVLDWRTNVTSVPSGDKTYTLAMQAKLEVGSTEQMDVFVYDHNAPGWDAAFSFTSTSYASRTFALTYADHVNSGEVWVRVQDQGGEGDPADAIDIDFLWVNSTAVDYTANIDITYTQVTVQANSDGQLTLSGYRSGDSEAIKLQVYRAESWTDMGADIFTGSKTTTTYPVDVGDVVGSVLKLRVTDAAQTDNSQTSIYLDYAEFQIEKEGGQGSPVTADFNTEYSWWSGRMQLTDHSISYAGQVVGWNWYVDGKHVGNAPEVGASLYPSWLDVGTHTVHVKLEVVDEMGFSAVDVKTVHVDNSLRLAVMLLIFLVVGMVLLLVVVRVDLLEKIRRRKDRKRFVKEMKEAKRHAKDRNPPIQ